MLKTKLILPIAIIFFDYVGLFLVLPVFSPLLINHPHLLGIGDKASVITLGFLIAAFGISQLFGSPILGKFSDFYGRRKIIIVALFLSVIGYLLAIISLIYASISILFLSRILIGCASGNSAILFASVADFSKNEDRAKNMGYLTLGVALGGVIGPLVGGFLSNMTIDHTTGFIIPFIFMFLAFIVLLIALSLSNFNSPQQLTPKLNINIMLGPKYLYQALFREATKRRCLLIAFAFFAISTESMLIAMPINAVKNFNASETELGCLFAAGGVSALISSFYLNKLLNRFLEIKTIIICCMLGLIIAYFIFPFVTEFMYLYIPWVLMTLFCLLVWSHFNAYISLQYPQDQQGLIMGITQALVSFATFFGPIVVSLLAHIAAKFSFGVSIVFGCLSLGLFIITLSKADKSF